MAYTRFTEAMEAKRAGNCTRAETLLELSVRPPTPYKGHYRQLFICYRRRIRAAKAVGDRATVMRLVRRMMQLDDEMVQAIWSFSQFNRAHTKLEDHDDCRNLLPFDHQALAWAEAPGG